MSVRTRWVGVITLGLVVISFIAFQHPLRVQYHKARLQTFKAKRDRCMGAALTKTEKFWLQVTGRPISVSGLTRGIQTHEDALVRLGFLRRDNFEMQPEAGPEAQEALTALRRECPWYHAEVYGATNLVIVTACPKMMERWRKCAHESGWKESPPVDL